MLEGNVVNLRLIKKSDLKYVEKWINDAEIQYYSQEQYPVYFNQWLVKSIYSEGLKGKRYIFMIENKAGDVIGELWLFPIDFSKKITELVIIIGNKEIRGKGYGRDAINTVKKYCFNKLKLNAMYLKVFEFNTRAINCYKSCGFKIIGKNNKKVVRFGVKYDELIMELRNE